MFSEYTNKDKWNKLVNNSVLTDILQTWEWGETKRCENWIPYRFAYEQEGNLIIVTQILVKQVSLLGRLAYIPHGPVFSTKHFKTSNFQELLATQEWLQFLKELKAWAKKQGVFCLEFEPKADEKDLKGKHLKDLKVTGRNRQPKYKLLMDLSREENELLLGMKKNTRYNINYAEKKGVVVKKYTIQEVLSDDSILGRFYKLVLEMQSRTEGYPVRSKQYFKTLFNQFAKTEALGVFEASCNNEVIAMNISEYTNTWASSFYAGSNRLFPNLKASYLLRWRSIQEAKARGCQVYDFWGIVPDSKHHKGYSDNKLSFGGARVDFIGIIKIDISWKAKIWEILLKVQKIIVRIKYN